MENLKNGFYTQPYTTNTIAIIDNVGYSTAIINNKRLISNEKMLFDEKIVGKWNYEPFKK